MNTITANIESKLTIYGKLQGDNMSTKDIVIDGTNDSVGLTSGTTPDVEYAYTDDLVMTGSLQTFDFTALSDPEGISMASTLLTKKVRAIKFRSKSTNTGNITITFGTATAYLLFGAAFKLILTPGQHILAYLADGAPAISSSLKHLDITGTLNDVLEISIVFG